MTIKYHLFFQYMPLPLFFADDKLSFYKVMSDTQGYKHIHYVKDVSIFQLYLCKIYCTVCFYHQCYIHSFCEGQSNTCYLWEVGSHLHIQINKRRHVSDDVVHFWENVRWP